MCIVIVVVMVLMLVVSLLSYVVEVGLGDNWYLGEEFMQCSMQSYMFDGISLIEYQCQQM